MTKSARPRTISQIIPDLQSKGIRITPIEGKSGYWLYHDESPNDPKICLEVEITEEEMIAIDIALRTDGVSWADLQSGKFKQTQDHIPSEIIVQPRSINDIIADWQSLGLEIVAIDNKPGHWFLHKNSLNSGENIILDIELRDEQIINLDISMRKNGFTWSDIKKSGLLGKT